MAANTYGRQVVLPLTNSSGGGVIAGDVVIVNTGANDSFTTTTSAASVAMIGIAQETIANAAVGRVLIGGYAALVNVNASVTRGNYGQTHTVAKQAADAGASRQAGTFCQFLTGGTTPDAMVWPTDLGGGTGAPTNADYLVGTANGSLSAEIVVGTSPGGELGGTWASPTVDALHSGSVHIPTILLDYTLAVDITNQSTTLNTWTDVIANQNFTKARAGSLIEIAVRCQSFFNAVTATVVTASRLVIDSAGTPINERLGGETTEAASGRPNPFSGSGSVFLSGLTAAVHTVKPQVLITETKGFYCRASTNNDQEFLRIQVIEHG